eukprot:365084-Chlamydomonas_euryale.AAC.29
MFKLQALTSSVPSSSLSQRNAQRQIERLTSQLTEAQKQVVSRDIEVSEAKVRAVHAVRSVLCVMVSRLPDTSVVCGRVWGRRECVATPLAPCAFWDAPASAGVEVCAALDG